MLVIASIYYTINFRYEWMFEQNKDNFSYLGHIRRGREMFVTFEFKPDKSFHKLRV